MAPEVADRERAEPEPIAAPTAEAPALGPSLPMALAPRGPLAPGQVLALQRSAGNSAVAGMLRGATGIGRAPAAGGRCACGGVAGPGGECADCRAKRLALEGASSEPATLSRAPAVAEREAPTDDAVEHEQRDTATAEGASAEAPVASRPVDAMAAMIDADARGGGSPAASASAAHGHAPDAGSAAAGEYAPEAGPAAVNGHAPAAASVASNGHAPEAGSVASNGYAPEAGPAASNGYAPEAGPAAGNGHAPEGASAAAGEYGPAGVNGHAPEAGPAAVNGHSPEASAHETAWPPMSEAPAAGDAELTGPARAPPAGAEAAAGPGGPPLGGGGAGPGAPEANGASAPAPVAAGPAEPPAAVAGVGGGSAAPPEATAIDASSGPALLSSLAAAPASAFVAGVAGARGAAGGVQARERDALQESMPEVQAPTGLAPTTTSGGGGSAPATELPSRGGPELPAPAARAGEPPAVTHPEPTAPLPGSRPVPVPPEPAAAADTDEGGGGWWGWLTGGISRFFGALPTQDAAVSTDAGPRPHVDLTGDADPSHGAEAEAAAGASVAGGRTDADQVTTGNFGETDVRPTVQRETLRPSVAPAGPPASGGAGAPGAAPALPPEMLTRFDAAATPALAAETQTHATAYHEQQAEYERSTAATQADGQRQIAEADAATRQEQEGLRAEVRSDVAGERERWRTENRQIEQRFGTQASARRGSVEQEIHTKVQSAHTDAADKLGAAEQEAATAKQRAEAEAAAKKQEEEDRPKSWWERAKGAISSVFDAIRSAVTAIFDKLRSLVKGIIEAAKSVVHGIIEAARQVVVGLIQAFGEFVKGLVTIALAAFPEAAAKARAWIDRRVDQATQAVNAAAEALKNAATRILDAVGAGLDAALGLLQRGLMAALDALEFLAKAPFEAMELLAKIAAWIEEHTHFIEGCQRLMDDPDSVIEAIKSALGEMITAVPAKAMEALDSLAGQLGPKAQKHERGIRKYLSKALDHLKGSWWEELKKMGWTLLWPWPSVWKDVKEIGAGIPKLLSSAFSLHISDAIDEFLGIQQKLNSILGAVYGWFFIASVLIGAILGGIFGVGAGAVPGALAGAAFAGEVGEGLVIALIATEGAIILKAAVDLARGENTDAEDEKDYEHIGGSTLTIAITGAMMLLGELAADLAKAIWNGAKGLFSSGGEAAADAASGAAHGTGEAPKGGAGDAPGGEAPKAGDPAADLPESKAGEPSGDVEVIDGQKIEASEPTADGHEAKVTEEGRCLICSTCEEVAEMYKGELEANPDLKTEFERVTAIEDPAVKAKELAQLEGKLAEARAKGEATPGGENKPAEPSEFNVDGLNKAEAAAEKELGSARELLKDPEVRAKLAKDGALKGELETKLRDLQGEFEAGSGDAEAARELGDQKLVDEAQAKLDDLKQRAEGLKQEINDVKSGEGTEGGGKLSPGESEVWMDLDTYRGRTKTDGNRFYEWDFTHGDIEVYDGRGNHLGSMDPVSGEMTKPPVKGRTIDI